MCALTYYFVVFLAVFLAACDALNCRSDGGPKENEFKSIYSNCLRRQTQVRNSSRNRNGNYGDDDWRDPRGYNQRDRSQMSQWDRDSRKREDRNRDSYLDDRMAMGDDERSNRDDRRGNKDDRRGNRDDRRGNRDDRMGNGDDRMYNIDDGTANRDESMYNDDRAGNRDDSLYSSDDRTRTRDRYNRGDRLGSNNNKFGTRDERISNDRIQHYGFGREQLSRRDGIAQSDDYEIGYSPAQNIYHSSTQLPHRYKREKRLGIAVPAAQRSRYNPNPSSPRTSGYEDSYRNDERNSSENTSKVTEKNKACALHCFMENLEMTGDNGMPDKYLVTHVITKDVRNEDLRDFLQESIEECFQILSNENTEDKCEFSKNILLCLSEKGKANCDDWKDDVQF